MDEMMTNFKKDKAMAYKEQGNDFYKSRIFDEALKHYDLAIENYPNEPTFHSNKAAVYFEMKDYEKCL